jgi:hypothetical protein
MSRMPGSAERSGGQRFGVYVAVNVHRAFKAANDLADQGFAPAITLRAAAVAPPIVLFIHPASRLAARRDTIADGASARPEVEIDCLVSHGAALDLGLALECRVIKSLGYLERSHSETRSRSRTSATVASIGLGCGAAVAVS